jgi:hypothetical protein
LLRRSVPVELFEPTTSHDAIDVTYVDALVKICRYSAGGTMEGVRNVYVRQPNVSTTRQHQ